MEEEIDSSRRWKHPERRFFPGDRVQHQPSSIAGSACRGEGVIVSEWGAWTACRSCWSVVAKKAYSCSACGKPVLRKWQGTMIANTMIVSGEGVYDVIFDSGERASVSQDWLKQMEEKK